MLLTVKQKKKVFGNHRFHKLFHFNKIKRVRSVMFIIDTLNRERQNANETGNHLVHRLLLMKCFFLFSCTNIQINSLKITQCDFFFCFCILSLTVKRSYYKNYRPFRILPPNIGPTMKSVCEEIRLMFGSDGSHEILIKTSELQCEDVRIMLAV